MLRYLTPLAILTVSVQAQPPVSKPDLLRLSDDVQAAISAGDSWTAMRVSQVDA
jgi:hypothetical protein